VKVAERFAQHLNADIAFCHQQGSKMANGDKTHMTEVVGNVEGRHCIIIDDIIDTAETICAASDLLKNKGATDVWMMATHAILSDSAVGRLADSAASRIIVTNTIPIPAHKQLEKIHVLSIAEVIAAGIKNVFESTSVSGIFLGENQF